MQEIGGNTKKRSRVPNGATGDCPWQWELLWTSVCQVERGRGGRKPRQSKEHKGKEVQRCRRARRFLSHRSSGRLEHTGGGGEGHVTGSGPTA